MIIRFCKGHSVRSKNLFEYLNNYYKTSLSPFSEINKFKNKLINLT